MTFSIKEKKTYLYGHNINVFNVVYNKKTLPISFYDHKAALKYIDKVSKDSDEFLHKKRYIHSEGVLTEPIRVSKNSKDVITEFTPIIKEQSNYIVFVSDTKEYGTVNENLVKESYTTKLEALDSLIDMYSQLKDEYVNKQLKVLQSWKTKWTKTI